MESLPLKTKNRLSRQTKSSDLTKTITQSLIANGAPLIKNDTVLAIDISEITKEQGLSMEYLALVRNGSSKDGEIKKGYWLIGILAADVKGDSFVPLLTDLYSQKADDFDGENQQIGQAIDLVCKRTRAKGIWAMDRGGDRKRLIERLLRRPLRFVIRLDGDRHLIDRNRNKRNALEIALGVSCKKEIEIITEEPEGRIKDRVKIGKTDVKLPGWDEVLILVVVKGFGKKPLMLLTDVRDKTEQEILEIYLTRWKCDESYRFLRTGHNLEDVRVRGYVGLKNIVVLLLAVFHFLAVNLGERLRLRVLLKKILEKAKRFLKNTGV